MKRTLMILMLAVVAVVASGMALGAGAQGISRVTNALAAVDFATGARVEVRGAEDAAAAIARADHRPARSTMTVYGVSLYRDNTQDARANAYRVARQFSELHPGVAVDVSYESPYFRVEAGRFVGRTDAVALCGRVLAAFPKAVVVQFEKPVAEVARVMAATAVYRSEVVDIEGVSVAGAVEAGVVGV
ncbi:MAG: hypothetical protein LBU97_02190, partial [Alistipes sp.]|nr:hypothetical protein [Alistipes sp.]